MNKECLRCPASLACLTGIAKIWKHGTTVEVYVDDVGGDNVSGRGVLVWYSNYEEVSFRCPAILNYADYHGNLHSGMVSIDWRRRASRGEA